MAIGISLLDRQTDDGPTDTNPIVTGAATSTDGAIFLVCVSYDGTINISSVTDSKSNTYNLVNTVTTGDQKTSIYECIGGVGGASHTVTVTFATPADGVVHFLEITGGSTRDLTPTAVNDASSPFTLASGTLSQAAELLLSFCASDSSSNPATYACSGWTVLSQEADGTTFWSSAVAYKIVAATTTQTASWTSTGAGDANVHLVTYRERTVPLPAMNHHYRMQGIA